MRDSVRPSAARTASSARVTAVLGPTNTGKTHHAIERMLSHRTGIIGLPLRLLAREVYDRIAAARGPSCVALVTGEERIVPDTAQYWVCTVEAMPDGIGADFVAVDEIQLCGDPERGHVFTDRLLRARGLVETMFMGSGAMRGAIAALVPGVQFARRDRLSTLTYSGSKKISRMPPRSAIVGFSVDNVYAIAELIRRQKGGCAVVMGALSPRTRNAQVALYQEGEVDFLVATDAIGMGLNLDIRHVAFSSLAKFDGRRMRPLFPHEMGQIAGRAGRHTEPGTFGVTGEASPLSPDLVEALENHRFAAIEKLHWRNPDLEFGTVERLIASLDLGPQHERLQRGREADDVQALRLLTLPGAIGDGLASPAQVRLLWDVCRIPDFRGISPAEHSGLLSRIFEFLRGRGIGGGGKVPDDWLAAQIRRIDRTDGDIDTLSKRLAYIRTWTYVAQRKGWVADENHWRGETRAVEDRLSDALHAALTQRFVDRRTSVLLRRLKQKESLVAEVNDKGEVTVEGEFVGRLEGFRFRQDGTATPDEGKTLRQAAYEALRPEFHLRADRFYNAPDTEFGYTEQGGLMWGSNAVGKLVAGPDALRPQVEAFVDEEAGHDVAEKVRRRLQHFIDRKVAAQFEPLLALQRDEALTGLARGFAFRMVEAMGVLPRDAVAEDVKALDQEARGALRKHGLRFGQYTIFLPLLLKPAPTRLRLVLWSLANGLSEFPESPPPGLVTIPNITEVPRNHYTLAGYHPAGARAIRIDMLERLADLLRAKDSRAGFEATPDMLSITGMTLDQFADLMGGLGYRADKGERPKAQAATPPSEGTEAIAAASEAPDEGEASLETAAAAAVDAAAPAAVGADALGASVAEPAESPEAQGAASESPTSESPAAEDAALTEVEQFYTFVWAPRRSPRPQQDRGPRSSEGRGKGASRRAPAAEGAASAEAGPAAEQRGDRPPREGGKPNREGGKDDRNKGGWNKDDRGQGKGGKPQHGKPHGKGPRTRDDSPRSYEARPPRKEDRIDPDNPFAQALMALRDRK